MTKPRTVLARAVAPALEPLSLLETKLYLRVDNDAEDTLIARLIITARLAAEEYLQRSLMTQSWKLAYSAERYAFYEMLLPMGPVQSITSVTTFDKNENATVMSASAYRLNATKNAVCFDAMPNAFRVEIVYVAGYGDAASVPPPVRYGMLAHIAELFDARGEGEAALPSEAAALYAPFREVRL